MTKTELFKNELHEMLNNENFLEFISEDSFTSSMLNRRFFNNKYHVSVITKALKEYLDTTEGKIALQLDYDKYSSPTYFYYKNYEKMGKLEYKGKEKNLLIFEWTHWQGKETKKITYDFITKKLNTKTVFDFTNETDDDVLFFNAIHKLNKCPIPEWIFSYVTDIHELKRVNIQYDYWGTAISHNFNAPTKEDECYVNECPKGYINFVKETNTPINYETIKEYVIKKKVGNIGFQITKNYSIFSLEEVDKICSKKGIITNIVKNSWAKENLHVCFGSILSVINDYKKAIDFDILLSLLNDSDTFETYKKKVLDVYDAEQNILLSKQLKKLNFVNNKTFDNYTIVVPQSIYDLQEEGNNMHNCVGHYYNHNIIEGSALIYFIRESNNVNKSFVTCRYDTQKKETVEARAFSNKNISSDVRCILNEIDYYINTFLKLDD